MLGTGCLPETEVLVFSHQSLGSWRPDDTGIEGMCELWLCQTGISAYYR